ncbi:MAG: hypothetical protein V1662_01080 [Candidatus Omnitrophota bacterium]
MYKCAKIIGTGAYLPKRNIDNAQMEQLVNNFDYQRAGMPFAEWVEQLTGIKKKIFCAG